MTYRLLVPISVDRPPLQSGGIQRGDVRVAFPVSTPAAQVLGVAPPGLLALGGDTAQAVAEIRALTGWLLKEGCPAVALCGISYRGWLAGLTVCREARLAAVVLTIPGVACESPCSENSLFCVASGNRAKTAHSVGSVEPNPVQLTSAQPAIPSENILLIDAIHDLYVPKEAIEDLWQAWGQPDEDLAVATRHTSAVSLTAGLDGPRPSLAGTTGWMRTAVRTRQTLVLPH